MDHLVVLGIGGSALGMLALQQELGSIRTARATVGLLDAVDVLLTTKDSSNARAVKDLQPADRDVPSTIEVELTCGAYHLTCRKTYNRQRGTVLTIHAPTAQTLRGREAHDRLRAILEADVDLDLYDALRFTQGRELPAVGFGDSDVLAARLDAAACCSASASSSDSSGSCPP
jgi:hypothetical protein